MIIKDMFEDLLLSVSKLKLNFAHFGDVLLVHSDFVPFKPIDLEET